MRFSVIVPVYNSEGFIEPCLKSLQLQTFQDFEIILVNDGSTDNTASLCDNMSLTQENIKVLHKENGGQMSARLAGINSAKGTYSVFLDVDDLLKPNALSVINNTIIKNNSDIVIYGLERVKKSSVVEIWSESENEVTISDKNLVFKKILLNQNYNSLCRKAIRTEILKNELLDQYFDIRHGEDLIQSIYALNKANKVTFISDVLYTYFVNDTSISNNINENNLDLSFRVQSIIIEFLNKYNLFHNDDFHDLYLYYYEIVVGKIEKILHFDIKWDKKKALLEKVTQTDLCKGVLFSNISIIENKKCKLMMSMLRRKYYFMLLLCERIFDCYRHIKYRNK